MPETSTSSLPRWPPVRSSSSAWGNCLDPALDVVVLHERSIDEPAADGGACLGESVGEVQHGEALHARMAFGELEVVARPGHVVHVAVLRDGSADHDARPFVDLQQHRVEDVATDVVEEHVDAVGGEVGEAGVDVIGAVVDRRVVAEFVDEVATLLWTTSDADHAAWRRAASRSDRRTCRQRRRRRTRRRCPIP